MTYILKRRAQEAASGDNIPALTTKLFLENYVKASIILEFAETGRLNDVENTEQFFTNLNGKEKFRYSRKIRTDKGGLNYQYIDFVGSNGSEGVKVILLDKMAQFIRDYQQGKFSVNFTFEELVNDAQNL